MANTGDINLGDPNNFGTGSVATPFTLSATGLQAAIMEGSITLPSLTLSASFQQPSELPFPTLSATGVSGNVATGSLAMQPATMTGGVMLAGQVGLGDVSLPFPTLVASSGTNGDIQLPFPTLVAQAVGGTLSQGSLLDLPFPTLSATMFNPQVSTGDIELPLADLVATGITGNVASGDLNLLGLRLSSRLATGLAIDGDIDLPGLTLGATLISGATIAADIQLPVPSVSGFAPSGGTANTATGAITLPFLSATGTGGGGAGTASLQLPFFTLAGAAVQSAVITGDIQLSQFTVAGVGNAPPAMRGVITLPQATLAATAESGNIGTATIELPLYELDADASVSHIVGTASFELPVFQLEGVLDNAVVIPAAGLTGVVLNTRSKAVTEYAGLAPNSMASFQGVTLMATASGIVALLGDTDRGAAIDAHLTIGPTDLGAPGMKRVPTVYVGLRASGDLELTTITDDHHEAVYTLERLQDDGNIHMTRTKLGRGAKGMYWQAKIANVDGADFAINRIELHALLTGQGV